MKKYQIFLAKLFVPTLYWIIVLFWIQRKPDTFSDPIKFFVQTFPIWAILGFGVYSAGCVVQGVLTFNDCPNAAMELEADIKRAHEQLAKKGFRDG
mmetsp:Transcript_2014/g.2615  ORF Transcript_2014/g.2615 Transcript_2014/m.2615 type:complete len:96 (-) Transcript_2014:217-504(-)